MKKKCISATLSRQWGNKSLKARCIYTKLQFEGFGTTSSGPDTFVRKSARTDSAIQAKTGLARLSKINGEVKGGGSGASR